MRRPSKLSSFFLAIMYAGMLMIVSLLPSGVGPLRGWDASLTPALQTVLHVPAYGLLVFLAIMALASTWPGWRAIVFVTAAGCFALGVLLEFVQSMVPGRTGSVLDIAFNAVGVLGGIAAAYVWLTLVPERQDQ